MEPEWPLVGRTSELERVGLLLKNGNGAVVLAGPAGVGKTRFAAECLALADHRGFVTARVTATHAAAGLPFGAFASLLPDLTPGADRTEVVRQVARAIRAKGDGKPVALLVDDAHLLDDASAVLTHQLAASQDTFVLVTLRSGEPASDAVTALWKDGVAERLELSALSVDQVDTLLAAVLGGPADGATVHLLWERSSGNALFLKELVIGAVEAGVLRGEAGLWRIHGRLPATDRLVELIEARLAGLGEADRGALEVLALGEPLGVDLLQEFDGGVRLDALERAGVVRIEESRRRLEARLAHPLFGDVLRPRLSPLRTRAVSRWLADAVERSGARRREDVLRVATWRLTGGGSLRPDVMLAAAVDARRRHDLVLAERLAQASIEAGGGFEAGLFLGQLWWLQGRGEEADQEAATLVSQAATDAQRAQLAGSRISILEFSLRRAEAIRVAEEAEALIVDPACRDEVTAEHALLLSRAGQTTAALELTEPLLARSEGRTLVSVCFAAARCLGLTGRIGTAIDAAQRGLATQLAMAGPALAFGPELHVVHHTFALNYAGRLLEAEELVADRYRQAVAEGSTEAIAFLSYSLGETALARGHVASATRFAREAAASFRPMGWASPVRQSLICLAQALALSGAADEAGQAVLEIDGLGFPPTDLRGAELLQARAWTKVAKGDLAAARGHLEEAASMARTNGDAALEAGALHSSARLGQAKQVVDRLEQLAAIMEGDLVHARAAHATALARGDERGLEGVSGDFETMGADLLAAEAAADAAVAWRKSGEPRRAAAAERRAYALADRCEGAKTPALTRVTARAALSARELEIARLAAAGVPNKEIAVRLYLSRHTVENKLHSAYEKLGIEGRAELVEVLEGY